MSDDRLTDPTPGVTLGASRTKVLDAVRAGGDVLLYDDNGAEPGMDAAEKLAPESPAAGLVAGEGGGTLTSLDFSPLICPDGRCSPVLGDSYVYLDDDHLTKRFVQQTITPAMTEALDGPDGPRSIRDLG